MHAPAPCPAPAEPRDSDPLAGRWVSPGGPSLGGYNDDNIIIHHNYNTPIISNIVYTHHDNISIHHTHIQLNIIDFMMMTVTITNNISQNMY